MTACVCKDGIERYYASKTRCSACALKEQCTSNKDARIISRYAHEAAHEKAHQIAKTDAYTDASRRRKKVEMHLAHLKKIMRLKWSDGGQVKKFSL
ncbi:transposase [uncultured Tateyamaria sp.]|uniref:transposase n=1 Tax=uncultured Tateyamaria sp. TaxID=455651 RepID=UPI0026291940|nr:transposase [uncultured Tateyamaria sp.]